jgi:hypothetical protein
VAARNWRSNWKKGDTAITSPSRPSHKRKWQ